MPNDSTRDASRWHELRMLTRSPLDALRRWRGYAAYGRACLASEQYRRARQSERIEREKTPRRTDVINFLVSRFARPVRYLEIGVRDPADNFNAVAAAWKCSVDPGLEFAPNPVDFRMTSDAFFDAWRRGDILSPDQRFDIVFIDGLHHAEQVERDIENVLQVLASDGFVVLHDCNPPSEWHAREGFADVFTPAGRAWNGTTWKAFLRRRSDPSVFSCCVDTDFGVGVISPSRRIGAPIAPVNPYFEYRVLAAHRTEHLNLIDFERFQSLLPDGAA